MEKINPCKKLIENMQKLLEDTVSCLSQIEEDYLVQIKSTQPGLPRVHSNSFREISGFFLECKKDNKQCLP